MNTPDNTTTLVEVKRGDTTDKIYIPYCILWDVGRQTTDSGIGVLGNYSKNFWGKKEKKKYKV